MEEEKKPHVIKMLEELFTKYCKAIEKGETPDFTELQYCIMVGGGFIPIVSANVSIGIAKQGLKQHPNSTLLKTVLAKNYIKLNLLDEAKPLVTELDILMPNDPQTRIAKGAYLIKSGKIEEGISDFDYAISIAEEEAVARNATTQIGITVDPVDNKAKILTEVGQMLSDADMPERAIPYLSEAIELGDEQYMSAMTLASCYIRIEDYKEAVEVYDSILEVEPFLSVVWIALATLYMKINDYDNAIEACEYVLAYDKSFHDALHIRSNAYIKKGEFEKASDGLEECIKVADKVVDKDRSYMKLFELYAETENYEGLEKYGKKLIELHPETHWGWMYVANALINTEKWGEALPYVEKTLEFDPDFEDFLFYHALNCIMIGQHEKALHSFKRVLEVNPEYENIAHVYNYMSISYYEMGDKEKAMEYNKKARESDPEIAPYEEESGGGKK